VSSRPLYIFPHQGLGDHILCSGIYRRLATNRPFLVVATTVNNANSVSQMLSDVPNIQVEIYKHSYDNLRIDAHAVLLGKFGYDVLRLGYTGENFFSNPKERLDENFYRQAGIDISSRWEFFKLNRNRQRENELLNRLVKTPSPFIFVHEDRSRGFDIDLAKLPKGIEIIQPFPNLSKEFTVFDYLSVIEKATEIHCIESSFCALIESMQYDIPKYAHRYARPEAKADYRHEFTYRSKWEILL